MLIGGREKTLKEILTSILLLFIFWMILTLPKDPISNLGFINAVQHILLGLLFSFIITLIMPKPLFRDEQIRKFLNPKALFIFFSLFFMRLSIAMIVAGMDVAYRIMRPKIFISPGIVVVETPLKDDIEISLNANSITLTPGTITLDVEKTERGSRFYIHCISQKSLNTILKTGGFVKQIQAIFD